MIESTQRNNRYLTFASKFNKSLKAAKSAAEIEVEKINKEIKSLEDKKSSLTDKMTQLSLMEE